MMLLVVADGYVVDRARVLVAVLIIGDEGVGVVSTAAAEVADRHQADVYIVLSEEFRRKVHIDGLVSYD